MAKCDDNNFELQEICSNYQRHPTNDDCFTKHLVLNVVRCIFLHISGITVVPTKRAYNHNESCIILNLYNYLFV